MEGKSLTSQEEHFKELDFAARRNDVAAMEAALSILNDTSNPNMRSKMTIAWLEYRTKMLAQAKAAQPAPAHASESHTTTNNEENLDEIRERFAGRSTGKPVSTDVPTESSEE